jgi:hypothetical protein
VFLKQFERHATTFNVRFGQVRCGHCFPEPHRAQPDLKKDYRPKKPIIFLTSAVTRPSCRCR